MKDITKVAFVLGTRAQIIKTAPLMKLMDEKGYNYRFIYTAQHKTTIDKLIENFGIKKPDYTVLKWDKEAKTISLFVWHWLINIIWFLLFKKREIVPFTKGIIITHGDTTSTVWAALLGKLTGNKVMHIESGLRSFNLFNPFPEEINRIITFYLTNIYVCPNKWALNNLKKFRGTKINTRVNTQYDALKTALQQFDNIDFSLPEHKFFVASIHRYENIFKKRNLLKIIEIIRNISEKIECIFILHPPTEKQLRKNNLFEKLESGKNIQLLPRLDFFTFTKLIFNAEFVATDGGSNQEELSYLGKPTLILRKNTERLEGINKNAVLSQLKMKKIDGFIKEYKELQTNVIDFTVSPSKIILHWLEQSNFI